MKACDCCNKRMQTSGVRVLCGYPSNYDECDFDFCDDKCFQIFFQREWTKKEKNKK